MERKIQLNVYLPERYRDRLQRLAGQRMLENPKRAVSGSTVAAEILCGYLDRIEKAKPKEEEEL